LLIFHKKYSIIDFDLYLSNKHGGDTMATGLEIRTVQKAHLHDLLKAKQGDMTIDDLIEKMEASMESEDFAYVEKIIEKRKK